MTGKQLIEVGAHEVEVCAIFATHDRTYQFMQSHVPDIPQVALLSNFGAPFSQSKCPLVFSGLLRDEPASQEG